MAKSVTQAQSEELAKTLWDIANELWGHMDASKYKNYILGIIFYRYLSERTETYVNDLLVDDGVSYQEVMANPKHVELAKTVKKMSIDHLGYLIKPQHLYSALVAKIEAKTFSIKDLEEAISNLTGSTIGKKSEAAFDKLFDDMNLQDKDLGKTVSERTALISKVMSKISKITFGVGQASIDVLGTAYMILIGWFASSAGKKGGEFFTPSSVSALVARLATVGFAEVTSVCDPCAGSGSLLLEVQKHLTKHKVGHFYGCELNGSTYNLLRMNWLMHGLTYGQFTAYNDDCIATDNFYEDGSPVLMQAQVSNPPFSSKWGAESKYEKDPRFSAAGALAPKSYQDFVFVENIVYHMAPNGRAAIILPHGILFRGNNEKTIREYLIGTLNCVDAIIGLPANLFHGTSIPTIVLVLRKNRNGDAGNICFIDASQYYKAGKNMNELREEDVDRIVDAYIARKDIDKFCHIAELEEVTGKNKYNCNIPRYVDTFEPEVPVDLDKVQAQIADARNRKKAALDNVNAMLAQLGLKGV